MSNKRTIAKNTFFLYFRMLFSMFLALFISRLILKYLGATDYGIYGVVGSVVTMFSFFNSAMTTAGQRCLSVDLANDKKRYSKTYGSIFIISLLLAFVVIFILQIFAPNFIRNTLNIPPERIKVAIYVFHATCISFLLNTLKIPFTSSLIAQERFNIYAIISVLDTLFLLLVSILLKYTSFDKLLFYSYGIVFNRILILILFIFYGLKDQRISFNISKENILELTRFFGWNILGGLSSVGLYQGMQILLNLFFNPLVNTAQTLTLQVKSAIESFAGNIRTASNPQIVIKSSSGDFIQTASLLLMSMKYSTIVILLVSIPLFVKIDYILYLWLGNFPKYTNIFIRFYIINAIIDVISSPIVTVIQSIGNLSKYQIISSVVLLSVLPFTYILFKYGYPPYYYGFVLLGSTILMLLVRVLFLLKMIRVSNKTLLFEISKQLFFIPLSVLVLSYLVSNIFVSELINTIIVTLTSTIAVLILSWFFLLQLNERESIQKYIKIKLLKIK